MNDEVISARFEGAPFSGPGFPPSEFMVMPGGVHTITAAKGGKPIEIVVRVDRSTAEVFQRALQAHAARGKQRPYFDFDHDETAASAWPTEFSWRDQPAPGVYAAVEWSDRGAEAITGKSYRAFSPAFTVDKYVTSAESPARVKGVPLVMGGLVNDPAFEAIQPLWASRAGAGLEFNQEQARKTTQLNIMNIEVTSDLDNAIKAYGKAPCSLDRGVIYARGIREAMAEPEGCDHVIRAANSLGTLSGTLVVQRSLDLLKIAFPALTRFSTNFTSEASALDQVLSTRLRAVPTVGTYNTTTGYVSADATDTDVPVTIDSHKFCQVEFNANEMASTHRLLFKENEEGMHYSLGKDLVDAIYALFLAANYTYAATVEALVDFSRKSVIQIGIDMNANGRNANSGTRTLLLTPNYYGKLEEDVTVVSPFYNPASGEAIPQGVLPMVHGFQPIEAPNLITTANLQGFACRGDAVAIAVRPANDYTLAQPGLPATGNVQNVTNPDTGLTVTLVQFVNHTLGKSYMRVAWMRGVALGNPAAGQLFKSAP